MSWVQESGGRRLHKVVQVRAWGSLRPLEPPEAYRAGATAPAWPRRAQPSQLTVDSMHGGLLGAALHAYWSRQRLC